MTPTHSARRLASIAATTACLCAAACARVPSGAAPSEVTAAAPPSAVPVEASASANLSADAGEAALTLGGGDSGPRKRVYRLAAMGDSLTDARSKGGAFLDLLRERCPRSTFDNLGVGGQMVNQMAARFPRQVLADARGQAPAPYSDVLVWGGVNDLYSDETAGRTVAKIENDLGYMFSTARARGLRVLAMTVAPVGSRGIGARSAEARRSR